MSNGSNYFNRTSQTVTDLQMLNLTFSWTDYIIFIVMLSLSALIGVYFGFFKKGQDTIVEYLLGGKTMKVFPVSMSLIASHMSGITLLALPADVYRFGAGYWYTCVCAIITSIITIYVFLPVYFKLQFTSTYEYMKLRFDGRIRTLTSFLFAVSIFLYNPIVIYIPSLVFAQVTGVNLHIIIPIVCSVCIFYTAIGGLKAVVWSDTLQFCCSVGAIISVFVLGLKSVGGFGNVWKTSLEGGRLDLLNFDFDLTIRDGFWALNIGQTIGWMAYISINQGCVQRFLAVPTISDAKKVVIIFTFGFCIVKTISVITGLIMYTKYHDCDPLTIKVVERADQLFPYYVMNVAHQIPGLSGLFVAGIFSASLSSLSTTLNTVSGTIYEDFLVPYCPEKIAKKSGSNVIKVIVVISGIACTLLVYIFEHLGSLLPLTISIGSVTGGSLLGLFLLGMFFPMANTKGALWGSITGLICTSIVIFTAQYYKYIGVLKDKPRPVSTEGCPPFSISTINSTISNVTSTSSSTSEPFVLFRISFYYYSVVGVMVTIIVGLIVSYITRKADDPPVDRDLFSPVIHFLLPKESNSYADYSTLDQALEMVTKNVNDDEAC